MKPRARAIIGLLAAAWAALSAQPVAAAEDLVVDLSAPVVAITTGFTGADLLLFGVVGGAGDVVVVVRGPARDETVRRKKRIGGIWVNHAQITFEQVPTFYATAANRPLNEFVTPEFLLDNQIGVRSIELKPKLKGLDAVEVARFRDALVRNMQKQGLYARQPGNVTFLGNRLFRTTITFPANVATGTYGIDVYLVRDNKLISWKTTLMTVRKFGFEAGVFDFAHRHSLAYGVLAILIAAVAGWLAGAVFRRA
ncbi:MAG: TIGR02186 family protein [Rhodospirillales bacterium]|nr:TIGR02186 family protein [Rhodospirillales bacterium]